MLRTLSVLLVLGHCAYGEPEAFHRSYASAFAEFKSLGSPSRQINFIDEEIASYLSRDTYSASDARQIVGLRGQACKKNRKACFNTSRWDGKACTERSDNAKSEIQLSLWRGLAESIRTENETQSFLRSLARCANALTTEQLTVATGLALAIESKSLPGKMAGLLAWMKNRAALTARIEDVNFDLATAQIFAERPTALNLALSIQLIPFTLLDKEKFLRISGNKEKRNEISGEIVRRMDDANLTGLMSAIAAALEKFPEMLAWLKPAERFRLVTLLCVEWSNSGKRRLCETFLKNLEPNSAGKVSPDLQWNLGLARIYNLWGDHGKAIELMIRSREVTEASALKNWIDYALSNYYSASGDLAEAKKALSRFKIMAPRMNLGWLNVLIHSREQAIYLLEGNCPESLAAGERGNALLAGSIRGPSSEGLWIALMEMACYAEKKDDSKVEALRAQIDSYIERMPSMSFVRLLSKRLTDAANGRNDARTLAQLKLLLGEGHPEHAMIESSVRRILAVKKAQTVRN
jgi:hypothetical protein